jgi:MscS family membrane protein
MKSFSIQHNKRFKSALAIHLARALLAGMLFISPVFAFDYANNIDYHTFKTEELTRVNDIDYELSVLNAKTESQKRLEAALKEQRRLNIKSFLRKLLNGDLPDYDLTLMRGEHEKIKAEHEKLAKDKSSFSRTKYVAYLVSDLDLRSIELRIQFVAFVYAIQKALQNYDTRETFNKILVDFRQELIFNPRLYHMVFDDILKVGYHKGPEALIFLKAYDKLLDELDVFNAVLMFFHHYVDRVMATDSVIDFFKIDRMVSATNRFLGNTGTSHLIKRYTSLSIGQVATSLLVFVVLFFCYVFVFRIIEIILRGIRKIVLGAKKKDDLPERHSRFDEVIRKSLSRPFRVFLILFGLDIAQRLIFIASPVNQGIVYVFISLYSVIAVWASFRMVDHFVYYYSDSFLQKYPTMRKEIINFFLVLSKILISIIALLIILENLGVNISGILASLGIGGLAIALAARESLTNVFGSIQIIFDNTFSQGDWIVTQKYQGTVVEIGLRSTRIRTFDNAMVFAPNGYLANTEIKNWNKRRLGRRIKLTVGVTYDSKISDILNAVNEIREMLRDHPDIADERTEFDLSEAMQSHFLVKDDHFGIRRTLLVYMNDFGDSSINILVYCFSKSIDWEKWLCVKQDVMARIAGILEKNHLTFAFPSRTLYFGDKSADPENR